MFFFWHAQEGNAEELLVHIEPHALKNLTLLEDIPSLCPIVDAKVMDLAREDTPQIYLLCGRGKQSSLKVLRYGVVSPSKGLTALH